MKIVAKKTYRYPMGLERNYAKYLVAHVQRMMSVIRSFIPEMVDVINRYKIQMDDATMVNAHIDIVIDRIRQAIESPEVLRRMMRQQYDFVNSHADRELNSIFKSLFGVPLQSFVVMPSMPIHQDDDMDDFDKMRDVWVQQNIDLIASIDDNTMSQIRSEIADAITNNVDTASLTKHLSERIQELSGIEMRRATLIGVDQIGKLNGRLTQYRQQHAGIDEYKWHTAGDVRVRDSHAEREGRVYRWSDPPPDGHPGRPIRCRCVALPVIDLAKFGYKPKKGTFKAADVVKPSPEHDIINIEECKSPKEAQVYWKSKYNVDVADSIKPLDFEAVKTSMAGIERVLQEFPQVRQSFARIDTAQRGVMCAKYSDGSINFNPAYYTNKSRLKNMIMGNERGFHPKNTGILEVGAHECGHICEKALIKKYNDSVLGVLDWNKCTYAKQVIREACKAAKKTPLGKGKKNLTLKSEISGYALQNDSECLAEAVADYIANKDEASILSIEIWKILKRELG